MAALAAETGNSSKAYIEKKPWHIKKPASIASSSQLSISASEQTPDQLVLVPSTKIGSGVAKTGGVWFALIWASRGHFVDGERESAGGVAQRRQRSSDVFAYDLCGRTVAED